MIKRVVVQTFGEVDKFLDCRLQVFDRSVPDGKGVVGLVAFVKTAVEWAIIEFQGFGLQGSRAVVGCGWKVEGSRFEAIKSVRVLEKGLVELEHVYEYFFIYTKKLAYFHIYNTPKLVIKLIVTNLIL